MRLLLKLSGIVGLLWAFLQTNDCIPYKEDADEWSGLATAALTGKKLVQVTGPRSSTNLLYSGTPPNQTYANPSNSDGSVWKVGHPNASGAAGAGLRCVGVASFDTPVGGLCTIRSVGIVPVTAGGAITHGTDLQAAADGSVVPWTTGVVVGHAMNDAASGADCEVKLIGMN